MSKQLDIEQLQQSINALQKQLDDLRSQQPAKLEIATKVAMWKPDYQEPYYFIKKGNTVANTQHNDWPEDKNLMEVGNCFPTEELATHYAEKRAARHRLEMLALAENGMVPYEFILNEINYYIGGYYTEGVRVLSFERINPGVQYFPTKEAAQRVLDAMSDEDLVLLFGTANREASSSNSDAGGK